MPTADVREQMEDSALLPETEETAADSWGLRLLFLFVIGLGLFLVADLLKALLRG
jgi:hypothetical protein